MVCFLSAFRESVFRKMPSNAAPESDDTVWGLFKSAFSTSSSSCYCVEDDHHSRQSPSNLKRHRAAAFFMGCYICGMKASAGDEEAQARTTLEEGHMQRKEGQHKEEGCVQWWQESGKKRRKLGSNKWVTGESNGNLLSRAPAKFKRLLRRVRAEVRKLGQFQKAASFHYDPLSYSMNFDDGCWQHCDSHVKLCSASSSCNNGKPQCRKGKGPSSLPIVKAGARPCLWQRRQVREPKTLRITKARALF